MSYFKNDSHALYCGYVIGIALLRGVKLEPAIDAWGDYTDRVMMLIGDTVITFIVPPPPANWKVP